MNTSSEQQNSILDITWDNSKYYMCMGCSTVYAKQIKPFLFYCDKCGSYFYDCDAISEKLTCCKRPENVKKCLGKYFTKTEGPNVPYRCNECGKEYSDDDALKIVSEGIAKVAPSDFFLKVKSAKMADIAGSNVGGAIDKSKVTKESLCEYVKKALEIEEGVYSLEMRIKDLVREQVVAQDMAEKSLVDAEEKLDHRIKLINQRYLEEKKGISIRLYGLEGQKTPLPEKPLEPTTLEELGLFLPSEPEYKKPGLFNKKQVNAENEEKQKQYEDSLKKYNDSKQQYEARLQAYEAECEEYKKAYDAITKNNQEIDKQIHEKREADLSDAYLKKEKEIHELREHFSSPDYMTPQVLESNLLLDELAIAKQKYKELVGLLDEYYSVDVVFPKYRNLSAISMIYEYLSSGRVDKLEGADGAYNLYESELSFLYNSKCKG